MYREAAVRYASPVGLVVILYEEVIRSLRKAHQAFQQNNIEQRCLSLTHSVHVIGHLQSVLDFEKGAEVAQNISNFYNVARNVIVDCNNTGNCERLISLAGDFSNVAQAWQQVDRATTINPADACANPPVLPQVSLANVNRTVSRLRLER
jgi:flagellar secretion chaperone FliS